MTRTDEDTKKKYKCERKKEILKERKNGVNSWVRCASGNASAFKKISALIGFATVQFMYRLYLLAMHTTQDV